MKPRRVPSVHIISDLRPSLAKLGYGMFSLLCRLVLKSMGLL